MAYTNNSDRYGVTMPPRVRDVLGRLKITVHQNVYEADFEYGTQPLRWEAVTQGGGSVAQVPQTGGVRMRVGNATGDIAIRQSRPYHRYQPGKTMFMATACQFGVPAVGNHQRVGFFDDSNGVFWEQSVVTADNPYGIYCVIRSDVGGQITETRIGIDQVNGDRATISQVDFTGIQMYWIEYAWYGAGATRFGFWINGEPIIAHQIGWGNYQNPTTTGIRQQVPWARTGNLPVRYEQRNTGPQSSAINDMYHWGVSVIVEGGRDEQRGFTYSYGVSNTNQARPIVGGTTGVTRYPLLTIRSRAMGTQEFGNVNGLYNANTTPIANTTLSATSTASYAVGTTLTIGGTVGGTFAVGMGVVGWGLALGTYITALGTGSGGAGTYTLNTAAQVNSSSATSTIQINAYANVMTLTGTPLTANQYQGRYIYFPYNGTQVSTSLTSSAGTAGSTQLTLTSVAGIYAGMTVTSGTGILTLGTNNQPTFVQNIIGLVVTLSQPLIANASGTYIFVSTLGAGAVGRILYHTTSAIYFADPILGGLVAPLTVATSSVTATFAASPTYTFSSGGAAGAYTVTLTASTTNVVPGMPISGTGILPNTTVVSVVGAVVTISNPASAQISGTITFVSGSVGSYTVLTTTGIGTVIAGMSVTGTGIAPGAMITAYANNVITLNLPCTAQVSGTLTFATGYLIGLSNRGQLLPRRLMMSSDNRCVVEVIASTPTNPTTLTGSNFNQLQYLGSLNSFAERDITSTALTGGEVVFAFTLASGSGLQDIDFSYFFPLYNNIRGSGVDTLTLAISVVPNAQAVVSGHLICQEAMS
jgi:hypothetical protein